MQPHQQRVIDEKIDLDAKLDKLDDFLDTEKFENLSQEEQSLMREQAGVMARYSAILGERVAAFPPPETTIIP